MNTVGESGQPAWEVVPAHRLRAARTVLADREAELLELVGPCRVHGCRLHRAHRGPCDIREREIPECYCCTCPDRGWDAACRNHGAHGVQPCSRHGLPGDLRCTCGCEAS